jgi:hypothetical protein
LIDRLVAIAMDSATFRRAQTMLASHPDDSWLAGMEAALDRQSSTLPVAVVAETERIGMLDTVAWLFSDPENVRGGRYSKQVATFFNSTSPGFPKGRLGTYWENRDAVNRLHDRFKGMISLERFEREEGDSAGTTSTGLMILDGLMPAWSHNLGSFDTHEQEQRALRVCIALERYRAAHGEYPASLTDLRAGVGAELPHDPWTGRPFGYRRIGATTDTLGRGYLLYSFGADQRDDGGAEAADPRSALFNAQARRAGKAAGGTDFILNVPVIPPPLKHVPRLPEVAAPAP